MDKNIFITQIQRLGQAYNNTMTTAMIAFWYSEVKEEVFHDKDITSGVSRLIGAGERYFPNLALFIKACKDSKYERLRGESQAQHINEDRYRNVSQGDLLAKGLKGSPKAQALVKNAYALLTGEIDKKTWLEKQKVLATDGQSVKMIREMEEELKA